MLTRLMVASKAEIRKFDHYLSIILDIHQEILQFDVSVHDAIFVAEV